MLSRESFYGSRRWHNGKTPGRMLKKAVQQGRRSTADPRFTFHVSPFTVLESDTRTPLADFFSILQDWGIQEVKNAVVSSRRRVLD